MKALTRAIKKLPFATTFYRETRDGRVLKRTPRRCPLGFLIAGTPMMEAGLFEPEETEFLQLAFRNVTTVVNVGANYGYYSLLARSMGKKVIAFEPHVLNFPVLLRNLDLNEWNDVEAFPLALAEKAGVRRIYGSGTGASLVPGWAGNAETRFRLVPVSTLDRILGDGLSQTPSIFVIDVEGAEYRVLLGATKQLHLNPAPVWFIEISITGLQPEGTVVNPYLLQTFQIFWDKGYLAYQLKNGYQLVTAITISEWINRPPADSGGNFVFAQPGAQLPQYSAGITQSHSLL